MEMYLQNLFNMQSDMQAESISIHFQRVILKNYIKFPHSVDHSQSESHVQTCSPVYEPMTFLSNSYLYTLGQNKGI